ncbi:DUF2726 domain-containing protein [Azonexus sp.]|uniref:DUF2726 domain-containing protein n=1 Tax=Azonexus sp. TaxID=1872668 RepID=UPI0027BA0FC6|nr:DUF2726 domain-containing protein [Azonexus sp.]
MPSRYHPIALALYLCTFGLANASELNRCVTNGKVTITDLPCATAEKSATIQKSAPESRIEAFPALPPRVKEPQLSNPVKKELLPRQAVTTKEARPQKAKPPAPPEKPNLLQIIFSIFSNTSIIMLAGFLILLALIGKGSHQKTKPSKLGPKSLPAPYLEPLRNSAPDNQFSAPEEENLPYKQAPVMSRYELDFFEQLRAALPECEIFPQVPLAAFIRIDRQKAGARFHKNSYRWQNRIGQQRVDYLVCLRSTMEVISAIELDDPSHENEEAQSRDQKKDKSLMEAGVRLIRWRVEKPPTAETIRQTLGLGIAQSLVTT